MRWGAQFNNQQKRNISKRTVFHVYVNGCEGSNGNNNDDNDDSDGNQEINKSKE